MLLYAMRTDRGQGPQPQYETLGELSVPLEDIKRFRQLDSRCAGHPEYRWTSGVETTTGPLGQGVATSVGMAIAGKWLAAYFNRPDFPMFDFDTYALAGDGCMMEGISGEAASLAGHLQLDNLCWIYDNNRITIEGETRLAFSEDVATRFIAYGWNVTRVGDANDLEMLDRAFTTFKKRRAAHPHHRGQQSATAPHKRGRTPPTRAPGEERSAWPEVLWLAGERKFLVPTSARAFREGHGSPRRKARAAWRALSPTIEEYPKERTAGSHAAPAVARGLGEVDPASRLMPGAGGRDASAKVLNAVARNIPWSSSGRPTPRRPPRPA